LAALQRDVEQSLVPLGFQAEKRAFHPHLTLGRTRRYVSRQEQRRLGEVIASTEVGELARIQVGSFRLMRSDLRPDGAVYTSLAAFSLGPEQETG
jgi:2'-5' RNA ligase